MRQRFTRWLSLVTVCFMLSVYCTTAQAALLDLGPTVPEVIGSATPTLGHGFPAWYRDTNRVPLEPCFSAANLPSGPACVLLPDAGFNPALPLVFPTNFPGEAFYFVADALITVPAGVIKYRAALEAAFAAGTAAPGGQITFARIRIFADLPVAGTYKFTHPYGVETLVAAAPGKRAITFTRDVGVGAFTGAVAGDLGPWLTTTGFPQTVVATGETFIGDPNIPNTVTGSPFATNFFRVDGPVGSNLDGLGNNFVQTNLFTVAGKINTGGAATPLTVDSATYTRNATTTQVDVFATTQPIANVTISATNLALAGISSALSFSDPGGAVPLMATVMTTNTPADGKFFGSASFANPATLPTTIRVTNTGDVPDSIVDVPLVDEVVISEASYKPTTPNATPGTLKIVASSGDKLALPTLTVSMKDGLVTVPLGTIPGGSGTLSVTFPLTKTLPAPIGTKTYSIPPESVTVTSAKLGSVTEPVTGPQNLPPLAVNDTPTVAPGGSVVINVAANDTDPNVGDHVVPTSVALAAPAPGKGTLVNNGDGTITYTAGVLATGTDTFGYTINDTVGAVSNIATVTVTINIPPVAAAFAATTPEDTAAVIPVSTHATASITGNPANVIVPGSVLITVAPLHGTATAVGDGTVRYTPALNYNGPDSFTYTVRDTIGALSNPAAASITVTAVADRPLALNDLATTQQNTAVTINVLANDSHPDGLPSAIVPATLTFTQPAVGAGVVTAGAVAGQLVYTPAPAFIGTATFTYTVSDNAATPLASLPATVSVTVTPISTPPIAVDDVATTFVNTPRIISVLANDIPGTSPINPATVAIVGLPTNGTAAVNLNGTVTFTSPAAGTGSFSYTVKDTVGVVSNIATVSVSVAPVAVIADTVSVLKGQFTASSRQWNVEGTTTNVTAGTLVTIRVGSGLTGQIIGTSPVATDGRWKFQLNGNPGNVGPDVNNTISVTLPSGASRLAFPIAVR